MAMENSKVVELEDALSYHDLLSTGATFQINLNNMAETFDPEIFDEAGSDDDGDDPDEDLSPWKKSFDELKKMMVEVHNLYGTVLKRITTEGMNEAMGSRNCRFQWTYSMFFEHEDKAFDSAVKPVTLDKSAMLPGLLIAAESMRAQEEAQFIINYKLMFGEMGCPPRVKPKANVLLVAKMVRFEDIGDAKACDDLTPEERRKFHVLKDKVIEMQKKALDHFKNKRYRHAISVGQSAIKNIELCNVANESEQAEQQKILIDLYKHLCDCYIETQDWKKACIMVNELRHRTKDNQNVKIMLNEAIALSNIEDDFKRSIAILRKAQKIDPHNESINTELSKQISKQQEYEKGQKKMWSRALEIKSIAENASN